MQTIKYGLTDEEIKQKITESSQKLDKKFQFGIEELFEINQQLTQKGYRITGFLGSGGQGIVFAATYNNKKVAVKCVSVINQDKINKEVEIMLQLQGQPFTHQFIDGFNGLISKKYFFYITELLLCDLEKVMKNPISDKQMLSYNQIIALAIQMTTALITLKQKNIFHFDLKPANILYDKANRCFKLSDYGLSKFKQNHNLSHTNEKDGCTFKYASPDSYQEKQEYNERSDIFSLGVILIELTKGEFIDPYEAYLLRKEKDDKIWKQFLNSDNQYLQLNEIIKQMLVIDRKQRITLEDLLQKLQSLPLEGMQTSPFFEIILDHIKDSTIKLEWNTKIEQIKFKDKINTIQQLSEVEYVLNKYQDNTDVNLEVALKFTDYERELKYIGISKVASILASSLQMCSTNIITLNLIFSNLDDEGIEIISSSIELMNNNLSKLYLNFEGFQIGQKGASSLARAIEKCSINLKVFGLHFFGYQNMGSDQIQEISQSLKKCEILKTLKFSLISCGNIGLNGMYQIVSNLPKNIKELTLNLDKKQKIQDEGLLSLCQGIQQCSKIKILSIFIGDKSINEQSVEQLSQTLSKNGNLRTLKININKIHAITPHFKNLQNLSLYLQCEAKNKIQPFIQKSLEQCNKLTSLCIIMENWSLCDIIALVKSLENSNLTELKLIFQQRFFSEEFKEANTFGEDLCKLKKIKSLQLFFFDACSAQFISSLLSQHLATCQNITSLQLGLCNVSPSFKITSPEAKLIGESLEQCKQLQQLGLYLWDNKIKEGSLAIKDSLKKCTNLNSLQLSFIEEYDQIEQVAQIIIDDLKQLINIHNQDVIIRKKSGEDDVGFLSKAGILDIDFLI